MTMMTPPPLEVRLSSPFTAAVLDSSDGGGALPSRLDLARSSVIRVGLRVWSVVFFLIEAVWFLLDLSADYCASFFQQEDEEMLVPHQEFTEGPQPMEGHGIRRDLSANVGFHGYRRVLIFPKGNNVDHLSIYLDVADSATLPYGWSRYAQFSLAVVNQIHGKYTVRKGI
ncbi:hypothetical protein GW17_00019040 [Ensete ventricosum]|nr:hypothetical protein GW17_00019040 [Ensete ventricosum]RZR93422.1 hypothetical protein BHM03_00021935 [Ensete ventricosum]